MAIGLIPQITKPTLPKHLRPIGISEVSSRIIGKVPQGRFRVQAHCQSVQVARQPDNMTVREARAGLPRPHQQAGGFQVSLDLTALLLTPLNGTT